ncbi:MAG: prolipoprotein diacylglyceryl transferase [Treponema sp.]|nr:prolipoprotein diacylglyceryl transferase [Treponema sp.]
MFPYITLFGRQFSVYAIMALCGIFAAGIIACKKAKKAGFDDTGIISLLLASGLGAFLGGHLLYGLTRFRLFPFLLTAPDIAGMVTRAWILFGGQVFYGGLFGGIAAGFVYGRRKFRSLMPAVCDMVTPVIPLFHFFGRLGCFGAGCCYGIEYSPGITFSGALVPEANFVSRLPVQLIEAGFNLLLFLLLFRIHGAVSSPGRSASGPPENRPSISKTVFARGKLLFLYLILYPVGRFVLEFFRGDEYRGFWGPLSTSQWISLFVISAAVLGLILPRKKNPGLVVLLGPKHSGKTSAGKVLADTLAVPFYDLDTLVEKETGKSPRVLYSQGEEVFRSAEYAVLNTFLETAAGKTGRKNLSGFPAVLATGGGIIDNRKATALLSGKYTKICLETGAETAWERIAAGPLPAFLPPENPEDAHRLLHERRTKAYRAFAGLTIPVEGKTPEAIAAEIAALF